MATWRLNQHPPAWVHERSSHSCNRIKQQYEMLSELTWLRIIKKPVFVLLFFFGGRCVVDTWSFQTPDFEPAFQL